MLAIDIINNRLIFGIKAFSNYTNETAAVSASLATKVFIQRDYSDSTICKFQTKFPAELDSRIERSLFEETVKTLNCYYGEAEKIGGQSYLEGCLACATAYIIFLCMETRYEKILKKISMYIQEQNEKIYAPRGLLLTDPIERGMRVVSFANTWDVFLSVGTTLKELCTIYKL
uniref:Golgin A7 family, member Bb n=1 Tax=Sinocyclocheilus anshuiensis TaxID=1608454 RepID=A0A671KU35_9TELE